MLPNTKRFFHRGMVVPLLVFGLLMATPRKAAADVACTGQSDPACDRTEYCANGVCTKMVIKNPGGFVLSTTTPTCGYSAISASAAQPFSLSAGMLTDATTGATSYAGALFPAATSMFTLQFDQPVNAFHGYATGFTATSISPQMPGLVAAMYAGTPVAAPAAPLPVAAPAASLPVGTPTGPSLGPAQNMKKAGPYFSVLGTIEYTDTSAGTVFGVCAGQQVALSLINGNSFIGSGIDGSLANDPQSSGAIFTPTLNANPAAVPFAVSFDGKSAVAALTLPSAVTEFSFSLTGQIQTASGISDVSGIYLAEVALDGSVSVAVTTVASPLIAMSPAFVLQLIKQQIGPTATSLGKLTLQLYGDDTNLTPPSPAGYLADFGQQLTSCEANVETASTRLSSLTLQLYGDDTNLTPPSPAGYITDITNRMSIDELHVQTNYNDLRIVGEASLSLLGEANQDTLTDFVSRTEMMIGDPLVAIESVEKDLNIGLATEDQNDLVSAAVNWDATLAKLQAALSLASATYQACQKAAQPTALAAASAASTSTRSSSSSSSCSGNSVTQSCASSLAKYNQAYTALNNFQAGINN